MIRKRSIIAATAVCIIIYLTNPVWLNFEPVPVQFDIYPNGIYTIDVVFNNKDNDAFLKIKKISEVFNLDKTNHVQIDVKRSKRPKRARINISCADVLNMITVKNIQVGDIKLDNFNDIDVEGADVLKKDNELVLIPTKDTITLTCSKTLNISSKINFDFNLFILLTLFSYLLVYKLLNYAAQFNSVCEKPKTEIAFLSIFFIFLFIPMSHIDNSEISQQENVTLAKLYPLIEENWVINYDFTKQFDKWFNDRFNQRSRLINDYFSTLSIFSNNYLENEYTIYNKKANFAFNKGFDSVHNILKDNLFSTLELNYIKYNVDNLLKYCEQNNVKLYIILSSDKETVYPEFYPPQYISKNNQTKLQQLEKALKEISGLNVVVPYEDIMKAKKSDLLYRRFDSHYTDEGSYIEYLSLIKKLKENFPYINYLTENDFNKTKISTSKGDCPEHIFGVNKNKLKDEYYQFTVKNPNQVKVKPMLYKEYYKLAFYDNPQSGNDIVVTIVGDSFHERYRTYLAENFSKVSSLRVESGVNFVLDDDLKKILFSSKPDILIIESTERFLNRFLYLDTFDNLFEGSK